jgi:hypothetical protein
LCCTRSPHSNEKFDRFDVLRGVKDFPKLLAKACVRLREDPQTFSAGSASKAKLHDQMFEQMQEAVTRLTNKLWKGEMLASRPFKTSHTTIGELLPS